MVTMVGIRPEVGTPYGRYVAGEAAALLQHLLVLDDLWTVELEQARGHGPLGDDDVQTLELLVGAMQRELEDVRKPLSEVRLMLDEVDDEPINRAFQKIAAAPGAPPRLTDSLLLQLGDFELRSAAITGYDYLEIKARDEADLLREKLAAIVESREVPAGDFLIPFRCAALIALVGAGVVSTVGLGGPVGFVAIGAVSQVGLGVLGWEKGRCELQMPTISFGRRG